MLAQQYCPILTDNRLGSMGEPVKVIVDGQPVFLCCSGCKKGALANPQATLAKVAELKRRKPAEAEKQARPKPQTAPPAPAGGKDAKINAALARLSSEDRELAVKQKFCAVSDTSRLGSMGPPVKVLIEGKPVFLCCEGCRESALGDPQATLSKVDELTKAAAERGDR